MASAARWSTAGLIALALADIGLIVAALQPAAVPTSATSSLAGRPAAAGPSPAATAPAGTDSPAAAVTQRAVSSSTSALELLAAADDSAALRAAGGGCAGTPKLAVTADGGTTWADVAAPAPHLLRLQLTSAAIGWLIGADAGCQPAFYATGDGGRTWHPGGSLARAWFITSAGLHDAAGTISQPCGNGPPQAMSSLSVTEALAVCDGSVVRTTDSGASWAPLPTPDGPVLAVDANASGKALVVQPAGSDCAGLRTSTTTDTGATWTAGGCLTGAAADDPVVVSRNAAGHGFAVAGGKTFVTADGGATWTAR